MRSKANCRKDYSQVGQMTSYDTFWRLTRPILLTALIASFLPDTGKSQTPGSIDPSFNPLASDTVNAVMLDADENIFIAGNFSQVGGAARSHIARLTPDGNVDTTFDSGVGPNDAVFGMAIQTDRKVVIVGKFTQVQGSGRSGVARLDSKGNADAFGAGLSLNGVVSRALVQPDGKVLIVGEFSQINSITRNYIARLNADGSLDSSFDPGSGIGGFCDCLALQADGKLLVGGGGPPGSNPPTPRIARLGVDGAIDSTFATTLAPVGVSGGGDLVRGIAVQPDGKIVVAGEFAQVNGVCRLRIARVTKEGNLDVTFDPGGGIGQNIDQPVVIQPDGKILVGGNFTSVAGVARNGLVRFLASGMIDTTFDPKGGVNDYIVALALQGDGRILAGGRFTAYQGNVRPNIARILADPPRITSATGASGQVGRAFSFQIIATLAPTSFSATGLPAGLSLDPTTGLITGTVLSEGSYDATLSATNASGTGMAPLRLNFSAAPAPPVITSGGSATGQVGVAFGFAITATNTPTAFTATGLPPGLTLNVNSGLISGVPTSSGPFPVAVNATNSGGSAQGNLLITITTPPANISAPTILSPPANLTLALNDTATLLTVTPAVSGKLSKVVFSLVDSAGKSLPLGDSTDTRDLRTFTASPAGDFNIVAQAISTDAPPKTQTTTLPIHISATAKAPNASLLDGLSGKTFAAGTSLPVIGFAQDANGQPLTTSTFFLDGAAVASGKASSVSGRPARKESDDSGFAQGRATLGALIGEKLLTLTGTDSNGTTDVSDVRIKVAAANAAPVCAVDASLAGATFAPSETFTATVSASHPGGIPIAKVEFYANNVQIGLLNAAPYTFPVTLPAAGRYALRAIATDNSGISQQSVPVIVRATATSGPTPTPTPTPTPAPTPPMVSVQVKGSAIAAEGGAKGKFLVARDGADLSQDLSVSFKLKGTAKGGVDYQEIASSVVIPSGEASAKVKIKPIDNDLVDGTRAVTLKLVESPGGAYTIGAPKKATISIEDND